MVSQSNIFFLFFFSPFLKVFYRREGEEKREGNGKD